MQRSRPRWLGWWYLCIAMGFALLATYHLVLRDTAGQIAIRLVLAAGFGVLSWLEFGAGKPRR